jgi:hypothetical protein
MSIFDDFFDFIRDDDIFDEDEFDFGTGQFIEGTAGANWWNSITDFFDDGFGGRLIDFFTDDSGGLGGLAGAVLMNQLGLSDPKIDKVGYQGGIPEYQAMRQQVPVATGIEQIDQTVRPMGTPAGDVASTGRVLPLMYDPNRRPGSGGRRYFTDIEYTPTGRDMGEDKAIDSTGIAAAQTRQDQQSSDLLRRNLSNLAREERARRSGALPLMAGPMPTNSYTPPQPEPEPTDDPVGQLPPDQDGSYARGGITALKKGKYLNGNTDGMADRVPATIDGKQPAALSDGEFVIPADVVSHLGNGNSDAGAKVLEQMMARVRKERTGNKEQGKEITARKMLPV